MGAVQTKEEEEEDSFAGYSCCNQVCAHKLVCGYASLGYLHTTALEHFRVHCAAFVVVSARMLTHSPSCSCDSYPREEIQNSNTATSMTTFECPEGGDSPPPRAPAGSV